MSNLRGDFEVIGTLTRRNLKIFLKDKVGVFFSLLAPLIILLLYVLFLKEVQMDSIIAIFKDNRLNNVDEELISGFLNGWLVSGMISVGCVTVSLSANMVRTQDKTRGILNDIIVSPVKQHLVKISYYLFNFLVTLIIMTIVFMVSLIFLAVSGTWCIGAREVFAVYGALIYSVVSAVLFTSLVTEFCNSEATLSAIVGITSAMIGFLMGAYIPLNQMPEAVQYIAALLPGTHSAGMMREFLMTAPLEELVASLPSYVPRQQIFDGLAEAYCLKVNFFGKMIDSGMMAVYIGVTSIVLFVVNLLVGGKKAINGGKSRVKKK